MKPFLFSVLVGSLAAALPRPAFPNPFVVSPPKPSTADGGIFLEKPRQFSDAGIFTKIPGGFAEPRVRAVPPTQFRFFEFGSTPQLSQSPDFSVRGGIVRVRPYLYRVPTIRPQLLKDAAPYRSGSVYLLPEWKRKEQQNTFGLARRQTSSTPTLDLLKKSADRKSEITAHIVDSSSGLTFYF